MALSAKQLSDYSKYQGQSGDTTTSADDFAAKQDSWQQQQSTPAWQAGQVAAQKSWDQFPGTAGTVPAAPAASSTPVSGAAPVVPGATTPANSVEKLLQEYYGWSALPTTGSNSGQFGDYYTSITPDQYTALTSAAGSNFTDYLQGNYGVGKLGSGDWSARAVRAPNNTDTPNTADNPITGYDLSYQPNAAGRDTAMAQSNAAFDTSRNQMIALAAAIAGGGAMYGAGGGGANAVAAAKAASEYGGIGASVGGVGSGSLAGMGAAEAGAGGLGTSAFNEWAAQNGWQGLPEQTIGQATGGATFTDAAGNTMLAPQTMDSSGSLLNASADTTANTAPAWNSSASLSENLGIPQASYAAPTGSTPIMGTLADGTEGVTGFQLANGTIQAVDSAALSAPQIADLLSSAAASPSIASQLAKSPSVVSQAAKLLGLNENSSLKDILPYAGLAMSGMGIANAKSAQSGGGATSSAAGNTQSAVGTQAAGVASQLLNQYQSGTLNASQTYQIQQWQQQQTAQIRQYYANMGLSNSTMEKQAEANIGQQASAMTSAALQSLLTSGLSAVSAANGVLSGVAQQQVAADQQLQSAMKNFADALGNFGSKTAAPAAPTPTDTQGAAV